MGWVKKTLFVIVLLFSTALSWDISHAAGPWIGRVVDYETGKPLEGVVVLAVWEKRVISIGDTVDRFHRAYETVTDENGNFEIPSYINITIPLIAHGQGPYTTFFKPGYLMRWGGSDFFLNGSTKPIKEFPGKWPLNNYQYKAGANYLALPKIKTIEERKRQLISPDAPDVHMPKMLNAIQEERYYLGLSSSFKPNRSTRSE